MESLVIVDTAHCLAYDHTHFFMRPYVLFRGQKQRYDAYVNCFHQAMHAAPMYIAETAPSQIRGMLISLKEFFIVLGMLVSVYCFFSLSPLQQSLGILIYLYFSSLVI